jgi:hypothetical protein
MRQEMEAIKKSGWPLGSGREMKDPESFPMKSFPPGKENAGG